VAIIFASGDSGAGPGCIGPNGGVFNVEYPSCPYITPVGATSLPVGGSPGGPGVRGFQMCQCGNLQAVPATFLQDPATKEEVVNSSVHIDASS
jgi:subtilase family serine protease